MQDRQNILVTGATGFIGGHLVKRLAREGHNVRVFLRDRRNETLFSGLCEAIAGNFESQESLSSALSGINAIYHLAAIRDRWNGTKSDYSLSNVQYTRNLLESALKKRVSRFIYCSSISVVTPPFNSYPYGRSKMEAENIVRQFQKRGLPSTIVRPVITYGPGDDGMIYRLIGLIDSGRYLTVGSGSNRVHLCYIDDLIDGMLLVLNRGMATGSAYCLCGQRPITINELVDMISALLEKRPPRLHVPMSAARLIAFIVENSHRALRLGGEPVISAKKIDVMTVDRHFDYALAKEELGYSPKVDYQEGLEKTVQWYRGERYR